MEVFITEPAEAELEDIGNFIAADNPLRADSFVDELVERCLGLAEHSSRYPVVTVWRQREIRRCPYGDYVILYSIAGATLEINHIVHSARDYMRILFPDA